MLFDILNNKNKTLEEQLLHYRSAWAWQLLFSNEVGHSLAFSAHFETKTMVFAFRCLKPVTNNKDSSQSSAPYFTGIPTCGRGRQSLPAFHSSADVWRGGGFSTAGRFPRAALMSGGLCMALQATESAGRRSGLAAAL